MKIIKEKQFFKLNMAISTIFYLLLEIDFFILHE